jgi:transposase
MRGSDAVTGAMFSYVDIEARVPAKHPIRVIRRIVNEVLERLDADFAAMYATIGRPSIAPEKLLRASLLQAFFTVRSERLLMERLDYDLMFRWFVGLGIDDPVWDHSTFSKNRDRLLQADIARKFLKSILEHEEVAPLLSDEHFTVDGTLVTAWASLKSFVPKDAAAKVAAPPPDDSEGNPPASGAKPREAARQPEKEEPATQPTSAEPSKPESPTPMQTAAETDKRSRNEEVDFHGQKRCNDTHVSTTDPQARLFRKGPGKEARLSYMGHAMTENRHGLVVETGFTQATGTAEREEAKAMIERHSPGSTRRLTVGADKAYDVAGFVADLRAMCVTPHVAQKAKGSAIDVRTTRHPGYAVSIRRRKLAEEPFGWAKTIGGLARPKLKGLARQGFAFTFVMAAYDLVRLPRLMIAAAA